MKPRDIATYIFLAVAWGLSFLVVLRVVEAFGWVGAVTFRSFIAAGTLLQSRNFPDANLIFMPDGNLSQSSAQQRWRGN